MNRSHVEAIGIFGTHGVLDCLSTLWLAGEFGAAAEGNPFVRTLLSTSTALTAVVMLSAVAVVAITWAKIGEDVRFGRPFAAVTIAIGAIVVAGNVAVGAGW
ncbi:DUF5658 family protein [Halalkalirubrum salinum]|uniref:DUF5658 family protein n=1 Tax=Halalkalirubrum salinum TaxID=2563889 RepID=UPI0010FB37E8|nr:DUF5658 family protein [Halalkalirubrum salinum]